MKYSTKVVNRLTNLVRRRNRELAFDAWLKIGLGVIFSFFTFGFLFWLGWFLGLVLVRPLINPLLFATLVTGIFLVAAIWSAWRRVNPMAGLAPMSDRDMTLTLIGQATGLFVFGSPRHASAGFALVLIGGPASFFEALGIWAHRLPADKASLESAAQVLDRCRTKIPLEEVNDLAAALLLLRLALIKAIPHDDSRALTVTEKGRAILSGPARG